MLHDLAHLRNQVGIDRSLLNETGCTRAHTSFPKLSIPRGAECDYRSRLVIGGLAYPTNKFHTVLTINRQFCHDKIGTRKQRRVGVIILACQVSLGILYFSHAAVSAVKALAHEHTMKNRRVILI